ncbi:hypothetical protein IFM51744_10677 [Aspergillus udagawae]|nr:hypothetical protein IFM51744_10677 [Aspergillus udagawae]
MSTSQSNTPSIMYSEEEESSEKAKDEDGKSPPRPQELLLTPGDIRSPYSTIADQDVPAEPVEELKEPNQQSVQSTAVITTEAAPTVTLPPVVTRRFVFTRPTAWNMPKNPENIKDYMRKPCVISTQRGTVTLYPIDDAHSPDCIAVPQGWPDNFLRATHGLGGGRASLSSATPFLFQQFKTGGGTGDAQMGEELIAWFLDNLDKTGSSVKILVSPPESSTPSFFQQMRAKLHRRGQVVSSVVALLMILRLHRNGDHLFSWLVGHAPPTVISQLATLNEGGLITMSIAKLVIRCVTKTLATPQNTNMRNYKRTLAEAGANIVVSYLRKISEDSGLDEQKTKTQLNELIDKITIRDEDHELAIKRAAVLMGLLISGVLKRVLELQTEHEEDKKRAKLIIDITFSAIGIAGHGSEKVSGLLGLLAGEALDYFWTDPTKGLPILVQDLVTEWIYWPLRDYKRLWGEIDKSGIGEMNSNEIAMFRDYFELVLRSNHFSVF